MLALTLFRLSRPQSQKGEPWFIHCGRWLAIILLAVAPEATISERAVNKAEKRKSELTVKLTADERERLMREHYRRLSAGPSFEEADRIADLDGQ